jgi:hypothetical protein
MHAHIPSYSEAIELLYTTNVFDFPSLWALEFLQDTTLPKRFASIRHISLRHTFDATQFEDTVTIMWFPPRLIPFPSPEKTWETTMKALKAMTGLRELEFRVLRSPFYSSSLSRTVMGGGVITPFEPLKKVSQKLDRFLIKVADMEGWYRVDVGTMERTLNSKGVKCEVVLNTDEQVSILGPPRLPYTVQ